MVIISMTILLMFIGGFFIIGYWWLLMVIISMDILLMAIGGFFYIGYW
jgi:hypothetical protein